MDIRFGTDRSVLAPQRQGGITATYGQRPFHGVISYGLRDCLRDRPNSVQWWHRYAHLLDQPPSSDDDGELRVLRHLAAEHGVLSFSDSAHCAALCLTYLWAESPDADKLDRAQLWNIKEGHVSSVWLVSVPAVADQPESHFILNVARDNEAGVVLARTSRAMKALCARNAELPLARVLDITAVPLTDRSGTRNVVITRNEYVPRALEAHLIGAVAQTSTAAADNEIVLIDRFRTATDQPAEIIGARGRYAEPGERESIDQAVRDIAAAAAPDISFRVDLNHGDLVWTPHGPVVVALT